MPGLGWVMCAVLAAAEPVVAVVVTSAAQPALTELETQVRSALMRETGIRVQAAAESSLGIDQAREAGWTCAGAAPCLAQLGTSLGVNVVVHVALEGGMASLVAVDPRRGLVAEVREVWPAAPATRSLRLQRWARALLGRGGNMTLQPSVAVDVRVDGEEIQAELPFTRVTGLAPGRHVIKVREQSREVDVPEGGSVVVNVTPGGAFLEGESPPSDGSAARWGVVAAGGGMAGVGLVGVAAAGAVAVVTLGLAYLRFTALDHNGDGYVVARQGESRADVEKTLNTVFGLGAAGGVFGVVTLLCGMVVLAGLAIAVGGAAWALLN